MEIMSKFSKDNELTKIFLSGLTSQHMLSHNSLTSIGFYGLIKTPHIFMKSGITMEVYEGLVSILALK